MWRDLGQGQSQLTAGALLMVAVCLSSWSTVYAKRELHDLDPALSTALQLFFGFFVLAAGSWIVESGRPSDWSASAITAIVFLAVAGSAIAFAVYYWLLNRWMAHKVTSLDLVMPVIAVLEGWLFLGEPITGTMVIAAVAVIGSVAMVLKMEGDAEIAGH
jgi:drug/metabolite transporter (DMT)-like permease